MAFSAVDEIKMLHVPAAYGEPPKGWSWSRLDEVSEGVFDCPHSTPKLTVAGPFVVRTQDIITGVFRTDQAGRVSEETYADRIARVTPSYGDLLYSREGTYFGIAAEVPPKTRVCLGQRMVLIRANRHRLDFSFLRHWLNSPIMAAHIHGYRDGSVAERLNLPTIRALPVLIPPLAEQKAIAAVLGVLDEKIELNRRMNATLEAMARALFQSWFVDFDPVRAKMDGREPVGLCPGIAALFPAHLEDSPLGHIPKGWEVRTIESLCDVITSGGTPARMHKSYWEPGTIPWFKTGELFDGPLIDAEERISKEGLANSSCKLWPAGTILFALYASPTVGRFGVLTKAGTANQAAAALISKPTYGVPFLMGILHEARTELQRVAVGAAQQNINQGVLKSHAVIAPPPALAKAYSDKVAPLFEQRTKLAMQSRTLATLRDTLLPKLLSGELSVLNVGLVGSPSTG